MQGDSNIVIYQTPDGETVIDVRLEGDTVWLSQAEIALLYNTDRSSISRHIRNIYNSEELDESATCAKITQVRFEGTRRIERTISTYNLDMIISIGYRVNSKYATQFRIWANRILKDYIIRGYAINQRAHIEQLEELKQTITIMSNVLTHKDVTQEEAVGLLKVIADYTYGLETLDRYDYQSLEIAQTTKEEAFRATYDSAIEALTILKDKFGGSDLFAHEKDDSFKSTMGAIYQTFDGKELYPSIEEKAANLLYLTVKNHSFSDGNKRIAAFLFLWFLERNNILYRDNGTRLLDNNTLVALTLMIAQSKVEEKDIMTKVVVNLINHNN
ncbi:MAG: virulence protein RhuM/Fic/DOC family protein [Alistipes sp.]|nr:virulence protein RhuM/Fic/DOC family protein [Alistipes sp.]